MCVCVSEHTCMHHLLFFVYMFCFQCYVSFIFSKYQQSLKTIYAIIQSTISKQVIKPAEYYALLYSNNKQTNITHTRTYLLNVCTARGWHAYHRIDDPGVDHGRITHWQGNGSCSARVGFELNLVVRILFSFYFSCFF